MTQRDCSQSGEVANVLDHALAFLAERRERVAALRVAAGFDGCRDSIMRVFRYAGVDEDEYFPDMRSFGEHIVEKRDMSCSVELDELSSRIGGNAPLFAHAAGTLGVRTDLFGTLGLPDIDPVFRGLSPNVVPHSFAPNNVAIALEFGDGKVLLAPRHKVRDAWNELLAGVGRDTLAESVRSADLVMLNNWSELDYSQTLWERLCDEFLTPFDADRSRFVMVDLADCSRRSVRQVEAAFALLRRLAARRHVVLGVNENEARVLYALFRGRPFSGELGELAETAHSLCGADEVVVHTNYEAAVCGGSGCVIVPTMRIDNPETVTGGGDHFNAGYALGLLLGAPAEIRAAAGNAVSSGYIRGGGTPGYDELLDTLRLWKKTLS